MNRSREAFSIPALLKTEAEKLASSLRERLIPHPGEKGTAREKIVRDFIQQQLPRRFAVSSGFVFDRHSAVSEQMDVVIYDAEHCPVFLAQGGTKFFPCEGVVAAGQIKSNLSSTREYEAALQNLLSAKRLDRSGGRINVSEKDGCSFDQQENHLHQLFTFVFVVNRCLNQKPMVRAFFEHLWRHERHEWPNITFVFDRYLVTHACHRGICPNPMDSFAIGVVDEVSKAELLLGFIRLLAQAVISTHSATFSYYHYLWGDKPGPWKSAPYERAPVKGELPKHLRSVPMPIWWKSTF